MRILHVPYTYFPDPCGGTEVYVRGLVRELARVGYGSAVAAPAPVASTYVADGIDVYRFATDLRPRRDLAYGMPDEIAADGFCDIVSRVRPQLVHLHARTSAVSERLADIAHMAGAKVVVTYHTPTVSCARGTMLLYGTEPCDGTLHAHRCAACLLTSHGVPKAVAAGIARVVGPFSAVAARHVRHGRTLAAVAVPGYLAAAQERFHVLMRTADHVVAVCQWVFDVLQRNGVPAAKLTLSRQGVDAVPTAGVRGSERSPDGPLRLAYFGRVDHAKGPDLLVDALLQHPEVLARLDIYAVRQGDNNSPFERLTARVSGDARISIRNALPADAVVTRMAEYDMIAVPSRWLETGPLVVLEAFAAGVPVLGARLGGIAELVRDGIDGVLVPSDDVGAWSREIAAVSADRGRIEVLRRGIQPPRTMRDVARDMAGIYARVLAQSHMPASAD